MAVCMSVYTSAQFSTGPAYQLWEDVSQDEYVNGCLYVCLHVCLCSTGPAYQLWVPVCMYGYSSVCVLQRLLINCESMSAWMCECMSLCQHVCQMFFTLAFCLVYLSSVSASVSVDEHVNACLQVCMCQLCSAVLSAYHLWCICKPGWACECLPASLLVSIMFCSLVCLSSVTASGWVWECV